MGTEHDEQDRDEARFTQRDLDKFLARRLGEDRERRAKAGPDTEALEGRIVELESALGHATRREQIDTAIASANTGLPSAYIAQVHQRLATADELNSEVIDEAIAGAAGQWESDIRARKPAMNIGSGAQPPASPLDTLAIDSQAEDQRLAEELASSDPAVVAKASRKAKARGWSR